MPLTLRNPTVTIQFDIENLSGRTGSEVAQVYLRPISPAVERPFQELKSFRKVRLAAGAVSTVEMTLPPSAFSYYDVASHAWKIDPDVYEIKVGNSSRSTPLVKKWQRAPARRKPGFPMRCTRA